MRLRVLHVTPYCEDAWAYGGIPRVVGALTRGLVRRGHHVTVCATDAHDILSRLPGPPQHPWTVRPPRLTADGVTLRIFPNVSNRAAYAFQAFAPLGLRGYLRRHAQDFDVAHLHGCHHLPGAWAAAQLVHAGVPYLVAPNGTAPIFERRRTAKRVFDAVFERSLLTGAAGVIAVSDAERRQLTALAVPPARIHTVPNPLDLREFSQPLARGRSRADWGAADAPVVLFLGKITPRKHVEQLVRAFGQLSIPDARLVIAGNDMGGGDRARRVAQQLGLASRTRFCGLLAGRDRLAALADADVVVYASEQEVFGLVPFEALLAGTPVVVAGDSGCGEHVQAAGGGLVVPANDVPALAAAMSRMLTHRAEWRVAAARASRYVRDHFGDAVVSGQIEACYVSLLAPAATAIPA